MYHLYPIKLDINGSCDIIGQCRQTNEGLERLLVSQPSKSSMTLNDHWPFFSAVFPSQYNTLYYCKFNIAKNVFVCIVKPLFTYAGIRVCSIEVINITQKYTPYLCWQKNGFSILTPFLDHVYCCICNVCTVEI